MLKKSLPALFVFIFFFTLVFSIYLQTPAMFTVDDPYYHIYRASALWRGEVLDLPVYSTLTTKPTTIYLLYYWTLAPFTAWFDGTNHEVLILGSKIYHALLSALVYTVFFLIAKKLFRNTAIAAVATAMLFVSSEIFAFRSMFQRPHVLSMVVVMGAFFFAYRNKPWGIFVMNVLSPLVYSTAFFSLVPGFVSGIIFRRWRDIGVSIGGLLVGIIIHPQAFHYVYNAFGLHLLSLFYTTILRLAGPGEFAAGDLPLQKEWWMILYGLVLAYAVVCFISRRDKAFAWSKGEWYTLVLSFVFFVPMIFVQRTIEYALPFAVLSIGLTWVYHVHPFILSCKQVYDIPPQTSKIALVFVYMTRELVAACYRFRTLLYVVGIVLLIAWGGQTTVKGVTHARAQPDPASFERVTDYLKAHSKPGDLVFYRDFALYNRLVFFDQINTYPIGMDPIFTYGYSPRLYWLWYHLTIDGVVCGVYTCADTSAPVEDVYDVLRNDFRARYVLVEHAFSGDISSSTATFDGLFSKDKRFLKVYENVDDDLKLYELK